MVTLLQFLQNARFPAPPTPITTAHNTTDVSDVDIGFLDHLPGSWKALRAMRDNILVENLGDALAAILGETPLTQPAGLDIYFSPHLDSDDDWENENDSEAWVSYELMIPSF